MIHGMYCTTSGIAARRPAGWLKKGFKLPIRPPTPVGQAYQARSSSVPDTRKRLAHREALVCQTLAAIMPERPIPTRQWKTQPQPCPLSRTPGLFAIPSAPSADRHTGSGLGRWGDGREHRRECRFVPLRQLQQRLIRVPRQLKDGHATGDYGSASAYPGGLFRRDFFGSWRGKTPRGSTRMPTRMPRMPSCSISSVTGWSI